MLDFDNFIPEKQGCPHVDVPVGSSIIRDTGNVILTCTACGIEKKLVCENCASNHTHVDALETIGLQRYIAVIAICENVSCGMVELHRTVERYIPANQPKQPKPRDLRSVLQDWVMALPLREQGTLLTAVRGCDVQPKLPLNAVPRQLTACLRQAFLVPADTREVGLMPGAFFQLALPDMWAASELGHLPLHWYAHLMHAAEVVGYRHPDIMTAAKWQDVYIKLARALHSIPETKSDMITRLSEDRIATGTVVS